jgi:hypothetical protein
MTPIDSSLEKYYDDTFSMMATPGWAALIEDLTNLNTELSNIATVNDEKALNFRKGQLDILTLLLTRKEVCSQVYEELKNEEIL